MHVIEKALGRQASMILPLGSRTRKLTVRLPRARREARHSARRGRAQAAAVALAA